MALYKIEKDSSGTPQGYELVAGGTLYADVGIGTILPYGGTSDKIPQGYLLCDGTSLLRASYPELFAVIGTAFGSADSTHFNIPDMRESVPVGSGTSDRSGITAHDSYTVGQFKDDQIQNFSLRTAEYGGSTSWVDGFGVRGNGSDVQFRQLYGDGQTYLSSDARVGTTTHGKQLGVNYIIKAKMVALPADLASAVDEAVEEKATRFPDYAHPIAIPDGTLTWTATEDCYIQVLYTTSDTTIDIRSRVVTINGEMVGVSDASSGVSIRQFSGYVRKGQVVSSYDNTLNLGFSQYVKVFPLSD